MTDEQERQAITAAIERLLAGTPLRSSGALDVVTLAEEAGVKRNKLTHKHTDLKDRFSAERKARHGIPESEIKLREEIATLKERSRTYGRNATSIGSRAKHSPAPCTCSPSRTPTSARRSPRSRRPQSGLFHPDLWLARGSPRVVCVFGHCRMGAYEGHQRCRARRARAGRGGAGGCPTRLPQFVVTRR
jgi:hypothetical protein